MGRLPGRPRICGSGEVIPEPGVRPTVPGARFAVAVRRRGTERVALAAFRLLPAAATRG